MAQRGGEAREDAMTPTTILANGIVLTCDTTNRCGAFHLVVADGRIADLSDRLERLVRSYPDAEVMDVSGKLILPGFVNAHVHSESLLLQPLTYGLHLSLWSDHAALKQARERLVHPAGRSDIRALYETAYTAHLRSGVTTAGEFPPELDETGFDLMLEGMNTSGVVPFLVLRTWDQIRRARSLGRHRPHVAVSLGEENELTLYSAESALRNARELQAPLFVHTAERREDAEGFARNFKKGLLAFLHTLNALTERTIVAHANHASDEEVSLVKNAGGTVVVCPRSTAAKQTGYPALRHLARRHVRMALGTDWGNPDMLQEMRFMAQLPHVVPDLRFFSPIEILRMATINGATALGIQRETGSLEVGKRADMVFFAVNTVRVPLLSEWLAEANVARFVVESLTTGDISDVMVAGQFLLRDRTVVRTSEHQLMEKWRNLHAKYVPPVAVTPVPQTPSAPTNIIPFTTDTRTPQGSPVESFASGFTPPATPPVVAEPPAPPPHPLKNLPKVQREPIKPELPKDTRRVFGEDDDV